MVKKLPLLVCISFVLLFSNSFGQAQEETLQERELSPESRITLDLKDVKLEDALRLITEKTGMKFVIKPELSEETVSIYLPEVRGEDALDAVLSMYGLGYTRKRDTDIYIIEEMPEALPLEVDTFRLKYAKAEDIGEIIKNNLSSSGQVSIDARTNTVIVRDLPNNLEDVRDLIERLDYALPQVLIRADIVELSTEAERQLGIDWNVSASASGAAQAITTPFYADKRAKKDRLQRVYDETGGWFGAEGQIPTFTYGSFSFTELTATLRALETNGLAKVLAQPRIAVQNDHSANINITNHIAVAIKTIYDDEGNIVSREPVYGDIGVELITTPHITENGDVILDVKPSVTSAELSTYFAEAVDTTKRTAETIITVKDGGTAVIGGLLRSETTNTVDKVPFLGNIPLIGLLFRHNHDRETRTDLVVFISPVILTNEKMESTLRKDQEVIGGIEGYTDVVEEVPQSQETGNKGYMLYK